MQRSFEMHIWRISHAKKNTGNYSLHDKRRWKEKSNIVSRITIHRSWNYDVSVTSRVTLLTTRMSQIFFKFIFSFLMIQSYNILYLLLFHVSTSYYINTKFFCRTLENHIFQFFDFNTKKNDRCFESNYLSLISLKFLLKHKLVYVDIGLYNCVLQSHTWSKFYNNIDFNSINITNKIIFSFSIFGFIFNDIRGMKLKEPCWNKNTNVNCLRKN